MLLVALLTKKVRGRTSFRHSQIQVLQHYNWESLSLHFEVLLSCFLASPSGRFFPGVTDMATGTSWLIFHWPLS